MLSKTNIPKRMFQELSIQVPEFEILNHSARLATSAQRQPMSCGAYLCYAYSAEECTSVCQTVSGELRSPLDVEAL